MKCFVSVRRVSQGFPFLFRRFDHLPCVTKLPKFRPTMQCHVAPLRESNCRDRQLSRALQPLPQQGCWKVDAHLFLYVLRDILRYPLALRLSSRLARLPLSTFSMWNLSMASVAGKH